LKVKKLKSLLNSSSKHPVLSGITATVFGGLILMILPKVWSGFPNVFSFLWRGIHLVVSFLLAHQEVPVWLLFILIGWFLFSWFVLIKGLFSERAKSPFKFYRQDFIDGMLWRWTYNNNQKIMDLYPFCSICDAQIIVLIEAGLMYDYPDTNRYKCEKCDKVIHTEAGDDRFYRSKIERELQRRIRTGEWLNNM
jgi:hypothetical protein